MINLDDIKMNVVETASNGVVNHNTIFNFKQKGDIVTAKYSGGLVQRGYLIGRINQSSFNFKYAQLHDDGNVAGGQSNCELRLHDGKIQLVESFEWGAGKGQNVFQQL